MGRLRAVDIAAQDADRLVCGGRGETRSRARLDEAVRELGAAHLGQQVAVVQHDPAVDPGPVPAEPPHNLLRPHRQMLVQQRCRADAADASALERAQEAALEGGVAAPVGAEHHLGAGRLRDPPELIEARADEDVLLVATDDLPCVRACWVSPPSPM